MLETLWNTVPVGTEVFVFDSQSTPPDLPQASSN
jgi:hypothetical protein